MRRLSVRFTVVLSLVLLIGMLPLVGAYAQQSGTLPANIEISSYPVGTIGHAASSGLAKLITLHTPISASVKPMAGATMSLPMVNRGKIDIAIGTYTDLHRAWQGIGEFNSKHSKLRHLFFPYSLIPVNLVVRRDSGITKLKQLKGKRVTSDFAGEINIVYQLEVALASAGMTWDDVVPVPVPSMPASLKAIREGRVDAAFALAASVPITVETDAAVPLYILPLEPGTKLEKALAEKLPGSKPAIIKAGWGIAREDVLSFDLPFTYYSSLHLSEAAVYKIVKAVWEKYKVMRPSHPVLSRFIGKVMVSRMPPAPFHPGAIRFYKEKGVWTKELEANQKKLLSK